MENELEDRYDPASLPDWQQLMWYNSQRFLEAHSLFLKHPVNKVLQSLSCFQLSIHNYPSRPKFRGIWRVLVKKKTLMLLSFQSNKI